jgi:hypothetical protein
MKIYWTVAEAQAVEQATTFEELFEIARLVASRMPQPLGIVCGPISSGGLGSLKSNIAQFNRAIVHVRVQGHDVFDQMPLEDALFRIKQLPYYRGDTHLLDALYRPLFESCLIRVMHFIPGWETSYGARWERSQGQRLGLEIRDIVW